MAVLTDATADPRGAALPDDDLVDRADRCNRTRRGLHRNHHETALVLPCSRLAYRIFAALRSAPVASWLLRGYARHTDRSRAVRALPLAAKARPAGGCGNAGHGHGIGRRQRAI